jgi:hypothetical protein
MGTERRGGDKGEAVKQRIRAAGARAREEAEERRKAAKDPPASPPEAGGRGGPDPARYGDWEKKGIASDF